MNTRIHVDHFNTGRYDVTIDDRRYQDVSASSIERLEDYLRHQKPLWRVDLKPFPDMWTEIEREDKAGES